jgi:hypothetical protein
LWETYFCTSCAWAAVIDTRCSAVARELDQLVAKIAGSVDTPKRKIFRLPR